MHAKPHCVTTRWATKSAKGAFATFRLASSSRHLAQRTNHPGTTSHPQRTPHHINNHLDPHRPSIPDLNFPLPFLNPETIKDGGRRVRLSG